MKVLRDIWLVYVRYMGIFLRNPAWVVIGILQPVLYLVLFAPLLSSLANMRGFPPGGAYNVFVPGLLIQLGLFGGSGVGFGLISELRLGIVERFRVTPVSRVAMLLGRALRDITTMLIQAVLLVIVALPFGLSIRPLGLLIVLALVALMGLTFASIAYALALTLKSEDSFAPLTFTATLPLLLLSGFMLPMALAPAWLRAVAHVNPLYYAVEAGRAVFNNNLSDLAVVQGVTIMAVLALLTIVLAARAFGRAVA